MKKKIIKVWAVFSIKGRFMGAYRLKKYAENFQEGRTESTQIIPVVLTTLNTKK